MVVRFYGACSVGFEELRLIGFAQPEWPIFTYYSRTVARAGKDGGKPWTALAIVVKYLRLFGTLSALHLFLHVAGIRRATVPEPLAATKGRDKKCGKGHERK